MSEQIPLARVVLAAPASGHGRTTIATGIMAALVREPYGLDVAGFSVGPGHRSPGLHGLATGRPGRVLDPWLQGEERIVPLLLHGAQQPSAARLAVIEGTGGLFDGVAGTDGFASTAHVADLTSSPVVLAVDVSAATRSIAAMVAGLAAFDESVRIDGLVLNRAASPQHADEVKRALRRLGLPLLGVLPAEGEVRLPTPAADATPEQVSEALDRLATRIAGHVDLPRLVKIAMTAPRLSGPAWDPAAQVVAPTSPTRPRIAVAGGHPFPTHYAEAVELMAAAGCEPVLFDPRRDRALPAETAGLYLGGGLPEHGLAALAANTDMAACVREAIADGVPTVAEGAGLPYLCLELDGQPMLGVIDATAATTAALVEGHCDADGTPAYASHAIVTDPAAPPMPPNVHASPLQVHWAGAPELAAEFCAAVHAYAASRPDLDHHGDAELGEGLVDLAVNVRLPGPPDWLAETVIATVSSLGAYPDPLAARAALAAHHGVSPDMVLPTAGSAEAFTLIARGLPGERPVVVHPQFTEPEAALRAAGRTPHRHVLAPPFTLDVEALPESDLLFVGNPTNPTSVLHDSEALWQLALPGRVLVVDEAFMDAVPGEHESLIGPEMDDLLVLRSFTKSWGLAGLRAGYVVGDPALVRLLAAQQAPWSVSSPALAAMVACTSDRAVLEGQLAVIGTSRDRDHLVEALSGLGWDVVTPAAGPFVLADTHDPQMRQRLRDRGFAVRRGETFPGLGPSWVRVAVRPRPVIDALVEAARA